MYLFALCWIIRSLSASVKGWESPSVCGSAVCITAIVSSPLLQPSCPYPALWCVPGGSKAVWRDWVVALSWRLLSSTSLSYGALCSWTSHVPFHGTLLSSYSARNVHVV